MLTERRLRTNRRRRLLLETGVVYTYSDDLALWYDWSSVSNGILSLAAQTNRNDATSFGPTLALTRATTASVTDYNNIIIKQVASGEERYTGGRRVENRVIQSNDFDTSWSNNNSTDAEGAAGSGPEGDGTAWTLTDDATSGEHSININNLIPATRHQSAWTLSCYMKQGTQRYGMLCTRATNTQRPIVFDLQSGTVAFTGSEIFDHGGIEDVGDGWYRCWGTISQGVVSSATDNVHIGMSNTGAAGGSSYSGTGKTILIAKAQLEDVSGQDDPAPSEYQATTTAASASWYATKRRTNLVLQSNDFGTTWANTRSTETAAAAANPIDATVDAWSLNEDGTAASSHFINQAISMKVNGTYTVSAYLKASNRTWGALGLHSGAGNRVCYFNLGTGVVGSKHSDFDSTSIEDAGGGWYRCIATMTMIGLSNGNTRIQVAEADNDIIFSGLSQESLLMYGFQLEEGSTATTYIATTTTVESSSFDTAISPTGLLVEEARTNICLQSEDFSTTWIEASALLTIVGDEAIAPDGTLTADLLVDDSSGGGGFAAAQQTGKTVTASNSYCVSVYAKANGLDWMRLSLLANAAETINQFYDLTNGVVGTAAADTDDSGIEDAGNGWYRCWLTYTAADTSNNIGIYLADGDGDVTVDLDGTSSIFVWGAQLEAGAFPTTYIPTVAASVTRNKDLVTTTTVDWYNASEGTLYAKASLPHATGQGNIIMEISDNSSSDRHYLAATAAEAANYAQVSGSSTVAQMIEAGTDFASAAQVNQAAAYALNDVEHYSEGDRTGTGDQSAALLANTVSKLAVGHRYDGNSNWFNGHIAQIRYYNERRANADLDQLSTDGTMSNGDTEGAEE